nr:uncharacterized protein K02A2.6-like [Onthophagus taurus]
MKHTKEDPELMKLMVYFHEGWPPLKKDINSKLSTYWKMKNDLMVKEGLVYINDKLLIPTKLRQGILKRLHEPHFGIEKTKKFARKFLYWPGISKEIETIIKGCQICEKYAKNKTKERLLPYNITEYPFQRVAVDICEWGGKSFLILADYYSFWLEVKSLKNKTSKEVIKKLKSIFTTFGIPNEIIADNNPFNSEECRKFANEWKFRITTSPHHSQANGLAERAVGVTKNMLKKSVEGNVDFKLMLLNHHNFPTRTTSISPAELIFNRNINTKLPIATNKLVPKKMEKINMYQENFKRYQEKYKTYFDRSAKAPEEFKVGENIMMRDVNKKVWKPGLVMEKCDTPRSYKVMDERGRTLRRNSVTV